VTRLQALRLECAAHVGTLNGLRDMLLSANRPGAAAALDAIADKDATAANEREALVQLANAFAARTLRDQLACDANATIAPDVNLPLPRPAKSVGHNTGRCLLKVAGIVRAS
jgi:hypothetical protein